MCVCVCVCAFVNTDAGTVRVQYIHIYICIYICIYIYIYFQRNISQKKTQNTKSISLIDDHTNMYAWIHWKENNKTPNCDNKFSYHTKC